MLCSIMITKVGDIMNDKMISILMQASTISVLFVVLLVVFFIALIAMTIALLASRTDKSDDDYEEDDDKVDIGSIFAEADKEAVEDSAFTDKIEPKAVDTYADAESSSSKDRYEEEYDDEYDEVGDTDELIATDGQREFVEQLKKRDAEEKADNVSADGTFADGTFADSAFADSAFADSAFADNAFTDSAFADSAFTDSVFDEQNMSAFEMPDRISSEDIDASVKEAVELGRAVSESSFSEYSQMAQPAKGAHTGRKKKTNVPITDDFYWFNRLDVEEKPDYKTKEMYYHHFNVPEDCIEELLIEMYDCALVRTEEIRYIAYGIEPRTISMKEIMGSGNSGYNQKKLKEPNAEDLLKIYAKWCSYVDELFEKVEIHADDYTTEKIRTLLCEFGRSDVDEILEGK